MRPLGAPCNLMKCHVNVLMASEPHKADMQATNFLKAIKPLDTKIFEEFHRRANPKEPPLESYYSECVFAEWEDTLGYKYAGMKDKDSGLPHGIVRIYQPYFGSIVMRAYKQGKYHGLSLDIESHHARVDLNKNGDVISYFRFDKNFNEVFRNDPKELIGYITAKRFKPKP